MTGRTLTMASIPTIMKERKMTANFARISLSEKAFAFRLGRKMDPMIQEMISETTILEPIRKK